MEPIKTSHEYSIEVLYHFKCGACGTWWTQEEEIVRKLSNGLPFESFLFFCPSCGKGLGIKQFEVKND